MTAGAGRMGLVHLSRSLQLDVDGSLLRGEDGLAAMTERDRATLDRVLARLPGDTGLRYAVRFHLHPPMPSAEIDMGGTAVSDPVCRVRETWVFRLRAVEAVLTLEPSVYLDGARVKPRRD